MGITFHLLSLVVFGMVHPWIPGKVSLVGCHLFHWKVISVNYDQGNCECRHVRGHL